MPTYFTTTELGSYAIHPLDHDPAAPCEECIAFRAVDPAQAPAAEWLIARPATRVCRWCAEGWAQTYWRDERIDDPTDYRAYVRLRRQEQPQLAGTAVR
jgi:hypothetical protein